MRKAREKYMQHVKKHAVHVKVSIQQFCNKAARNPIVIFAVGEFVLVCGFLCLFVFCFLVV